MPDRNLRAIVASVALLLACLGTTGCATEGPGSTNQARDTTPVRIRYADLVNLDVRDVPVLMALDVLEAKGYAVEKIYLGSSTLIADLVVRGNTEIAMLNNQTMWSAIQKGAQVRTIAQFTASTSVLVARPAIKSCRDLEGRRVGVATMSGLSPHLLRLYLKRECGGIEPELLAIPESSARAAALVAGATEATLMPGEEVLKLERASSVPLHILTTYAQEFPDIQIDGLHVARPWAEQHPEAVKDFLRALLNAYSQVTSNPQVLYDESVKRLSLDPATAKAIGDTHLRTKIWPARGGLTYENVQGTIDFMTEIAALPAGLKAADVADLSYLNAILSEMDESRSLQSNTGRERAR